MDMALNANVFCSDGFCGKSTYLVVQRKSHEITHVVVKEDRSPHGEHLIPVEWVTNAGPNRIDLQATRDDVTHTDDFKTTHFVEVDVPTAVGYGYMYAWPYDFIPEERMVPVHDEVVPPGEVAIHKGSAVHAKDGHIGRVDELLVDPSTHKISHLVLRKGHLWGQRDVLIPVDLIDYIEEDDVHLKVDKHAVSSLPTEPVRH